MPGNREQKRANGILKTASAFSQQELTTPRAHDLLYQHVQETAWGPESSAASFTKLIVVSSPHTGAERPPLACPVREL